MGAPEKEHEEEQASKDETSEGAPPVKGSDESSEKPTADAKPSDGPTSASKPPEAPHDGDEGDDEEDDEDEDEDDEPGDEEKAAAEAPAPPPPPSKPSKPVPGKKPVAASAKSPSGAPRGKPRPKGAPPPRQASGSLTKNMVLFILVIGALAAGFAYLGKEEPAGAPPTPKWNVGQTVDVEITLVPTDVKELACASPDDVAGKHCAFDAQGKPTTKVDPNDDKKVLRPYTTTDRIQFTAAGLWSQPTLAKEKLPTTRFSAKCKYAIDGKVKNPNIRWSSAQPEQWFPQTGEWYAGSITSCVLAPP